MESFFYLIIIYPLTQIIELVFTFCDKLFDNTGIAILGVSFAVGMLTLPLYIVAEHWQQVERDTQAKLKPGIDRIKAVFKGDERYLILSTYYKQNHYHPIMGLRSAFGLLIQIPFFTAAYTCLSNMSALQGQSFLFIKDMGAPDALFQIGNFTINILPIVMTLINCISGIIYTKGLPIKDKIQVFGLALIFVCILYDSPSGLVLYWTMNNVFSLVKNIFYKLKHPVKTLYLILCIAVTILIIWIFAGNILSTNRAILVSGCFGLLYFSPLFVKFFTWLSDSVLFELNKNFSKRFCLFIFSAIGLCLLLGLFIPSQLIASSPMEFSGIDDYKSPIFFIWNTFMQAIGLCIVWPCLIFFLYNKKIQSILSAVFVILFACSLMNVFVFQEDYGTLSNLLVFIEVPTVDSSSISIIINIFAIICVAALIFVLLKFKTQNILTAISGILCSTLLVVSFINFGTINNGYAKYEKIIENSTKKTELEPVFHLSKKGKNVLVIFLDRAQNRFLIPMFEEMPELYEQYTGFTLYKNTLSFNSHTLLGAAPCFGGYEYTPESMNQRKDISLVEKQNQSLLMLPRIFTEQGDNFSATITDPSWANYSWIPDLSIYNDFPKIKAILTDNQYADIWYKNNSSTSNLTITGDTLKRNILWYALFRVSPLALRPAFYNDGNYWSTNATNDNYRDYIAGYSVLDFLPELTDFNSLTTNTFTYFVNNTSHDNLFLQAPDYTPADKVTNFGTSPFREDASYHSMAGAMKRLGEYFDFLKESGVYDNTRIIIVADHGGSAYGEDFIWDDKFSSISPGQYHPLLMVKDFNEQSKLKISDEFMTNADVPYLATRGVIENPKNPYTETIIDAFPKDDGILISTTDIFMPYQNNDNYVFTIKPEAWWRVKDNIFDSKNWTQETVK